MADLDFRNLVDSHYDRLFRAAMFLTGDEHAAEDLAHETFLAAGQSLSRFEQRSAVYTWLYGILLNKFRRWLRRRRRRVFSLQHVREEGDGLAIEQTVPADVTDPTEDAEKHEMAERVREAVRELPVDHRVVIMLRFVDGLAYQDIADMLDCPLGTVKSRIHYALGKMGKKLEDDGPGPT